MGWTFTHGASKADVIRELTTDSVTEDRVFKTLRKCLKGNTMYALVESGKPGETKKWIAVYLLAAHNGDWGYKDIDETMGPVQCECPVKYLDEADEPMNEYARDWREVCRARAAKRSAQAAKRPKVGEIWSCHGRNCKKIRIVEVKGRRIVARNLTGGGIYRIPKKILGERLEASS